VRLWSLHPQYLDTKGLVALWRESLLAAAVLKGQTRGYRHHPQLTRFRNCSKPVGAINYFLGVIHEESEKRGYHFDAGKTGRKTTSLKLSVTAGQLLYEWEHYRAKVKIRDPAFFRRIAKIKKPEPHPLFKVRAGTIEPWEKV